MNYFKEVYGYYFKNFLYLLVFALVPAVFCGFLLRPFASIQFLFHYPNLELYNFADFFNAIYSFAWLDILWIVIGYVLIVVAMSFMFSFIENHFRTGKVSFRETLGLNNNILSVAKATLIMAIIIFIINLLEIALMLLVHFLTANNGLATPVGIAINYLISIAMLWLIARTFTLLVQAGIGMMINGSGFRAAFVDATKAVARNGWKIFGIEVTAFAVLFGISIGFAALNVGFVGDIINIILFLPIECVLGMVVFFDYFDMKKYDKRKYYYIR